MAGWASTLVTRWDLETCCRDWLRRVPGWPLESCMQLGVGLGAVLTPVPPWSWRRLPWEGWADSLPRRSPRFLTQLSRAEKDCILWPAVSF